MITKTETLLNTKMNLQKAQNTAYELHSYYADKEFNTFNKMLKEGYGSQKREELNFKQETYEKLANATFNIAFCNRRSKKMMAELSDAIEFAEICEIELI